MARPARPNANFRRVVIAQTGVAGNTAHIVKPIIHAGRGLARRAQGERTVAGVRKTVARLAHGLGTEALAGAALPALVAAVAPFASAQPVTVGTAACAVGTVDPIAVACPLKTCAVRAVLTG